MNDSTFYDVGLSVEIYDVVFNDDFTVELGDATFYSKYANANDLIFELGSGTGRLSYNLASKGFKIIGIENSDAMLKISEKKHTNNSVNPRFIKTDMMTFSIDENADLIIIPFRSFEMLLTDDDQRQCLQNIHNHLKNGGKLIIHLSNPEFINTENDKQQPDESWNNEIILPDSGNIVKLRTEMIENDSEKQICKESWVFEELTSEDKLIRIEKRDITWRWTYPEEMQKLLADCGFQIIETLSDFKISESEKGCHQIIIAEKQS